MLALFLFASLLDALAGDRVLTLGWSVTADQVGADIGETVSTAGDVNGDGYDDVVVHASHYGDAKKEEGSALVFLGSPTGLEATPSWTAVGDEAGEVIIGGGSAAGDVNGDGYDDLLVGAVAYDIDKSELQLWKAYLYYGSPTGLEPTASWTVWSDDPSDFGFAQRRGPPGDVNGDGYDDIVLGSDSDEDPEVNEGSAYLYLGSAAGPETSPSWMAQANYDFAFFGYSVSTGDLNGDGYDDVVVGAPGWENDDATANEGAVFAYLGSAGGLATTSAWSAETDSWDARLGVSVSSAGDVNGDGYADVVAGASGYSQGAELKVGKAYVFLGSASGLASKAAWTAQGTVEDTYFATSVASAGDVNDDGFDDVVIGSLSGDGFVGQASLFLGSATGLGAVAAWTVDGEHAGEHLGISVSSAGDVDGDGSGDVIVGADGYDNGSAFLGAAFVYVGGEGGPGPDDDADDDGVDDDKDCDDANADVYPGATEVCDDGIDNDCDSSVDEDCGDDGDGDGDAGGGGDDGASSDSSGEDDPGCGCGRTGRGASPAFVAMVALAALTRRRARH